MTSICQLEAGIARPFVWLVLQGVGAMGAGDFLMSFLGVVIISMGFRCVCVCVYVWVGGKADLRSV